MIRDTFYSRRAREAERGRKRGGEIVVTRFLEKNAISNMPGEPSKAAA
jgi:hypothetical protein